MPQKILFFANTSLIGGAERNILDLAANLDKNYFQPYIAALEQGGPLLEYAHHLGIKTFNPGFKHYLWPNYIFRILNFLRRKKIDVILIYGLKLKLFLLPISYFLKVPLRISMIMGLDVWKTPLHLFFEKNLEKFTSIWIANSFAAKKNAILKEKKPADRIRVIYNGLEKKIPLKAIKTKKKKSINKFNIITIANIQEGKGHLFFLEVIKQLYEDKKNINIEFIGHDYTNRKIRKKVENLGLQDIIKIKGFVENVREYIRCFDLMVLPSESESLPTSIIECMLENVPVVATNVGGISEIIQHDKTGWLIRYGDVYALVSLIKHLIDDPLKMGSVSRNARKMAYEKFDIAKISAEYASVFNRSKIPFHKKMKPVKILRIQSRIVVGGPALHTLLLSEMFNDKNFNTILVGGASKSVEKSVIEQAKEKNIKCIVIPEMAREIHFYDDLISLIKLYRLIKKERPTIFHSHTAKAGAIGRLAAFIAKVPLIYHTFHGHVFHSYFSPLKTNIFILLERLLSRISTAAIVISNNQYLDIVKKYRIASQDKVNIIPLGFDWGIRFGKTSMESFIVKYSIPKEKYLVGIIGRIVPIKDHRFFVDIAKKILIKHPNIFHFVVIGDGELRNEIEKMVIDQKIETNFTFTGWIDISKDIYQSLSVVVLTSKNEGTPVSVIESLVAGTPAIVTDVGGVYDIMKEYNLGYLIKNRDCEQFVDKIFKTVSNNERVERSVQQLMLSKFSSERLYNNIKNLYIKDLKKYDFI